MRDDSKNWSALTLGTSVYPSKPLTIQQIRPGRQILISGAAARQKTRLPLVGWPNPAPKDSYALVLRRDRILEIDGPARPDGWDDEAGLAISDMTDGYVVFHLDGPDAMPLLMRGTEISFQQPSASTARLCFGIAALVYTRAGDNAFAVHVTRPFAQVFRDALSSHLPLA